MTTEGAYMQRPLFGKRVIFAAALIAGLLYGVPPSFNFPAIAAIATGVLH
jgi:hypothetical protein